MTILDERSFHECKCSIRLHRSRPSDKELFSIATATIGRLIVYEASERPWSYWRMELERFSIRPEKLDHVYKMLLQRGQGQIKLGGVTPFDLKAIGFEARNADPVDVPHPKATAAPVTEAARS
jgi:hypothetical protein